jgi:hypothetical protein
MESEMGFHVNLLQPKAWIVYAFTGLMLMAAIALSFFNNIAGFIIAGIAITGLYLPVNLAKN